MPANIKERRVSIRSGLGIAAAAIGFIALGSTTPALAQGAGCTGGGRMSKTIAKPMAAAQDALKAKKWQEVLNKTREAESVPGAKSQFDQYWMNEFRGYAYHNLRQESELPASSRPRSILLVCPRRQARALQGPDGHLHRTSKFPQSHRVRQSRAQGEPRPRYPGARGAGLLPVRQQQRSRARHERAHGQFEQKRPGAERTAVVAVQSACNRAGDNSCVAKVFEKLVQHYPKPEYWQNLMSALRKIDADDLQKLNIMRSPRM
jgi:hypothetical protein